MTKTDDELIAEARDIIDQGDRHGPRAEHATTTFDRHAILSALRRKGEMEAALRDAETIVDRMADCSSSDRGRVSRIIEDARSTRNTIRLALKGEER